MPRPAFDVVTLRRRWREIVASCGDDKTQRVARWCCWENIASDLERYTRTNQTRMLCNLFDDVEFGMLAEKRLHDQGPEDATAWLETELGVKL